MSVEAHELMVEEWTRWQGHLIDGLFPLGRLLGGSEHSGVYATRSASHPGELAIKLVPASRAHEELQLPRWTRAAGLDHPHLLSIRHWGACQLEGLPYQYVVMEQADQTLAQLLERRALTVDEAREMLAPILDALAFLHGQALIQGQLKPTNILVVGDQLKLASDTVRRSGESRLDAPSAFDPSDGVEGRDAPAGDVWALGLTLAEALTRTSAHTISRRGSVTLPDCPPEFSAIVNRCLGATTKGRPGVTELRQWLDGRSVPAEPVEAAPTPAPEAPAAAIPVAPSAPAITPPPVVVATPPATPAKASQPRPWTGALIVAAVVVVVAWSTMRPHADAPPGETPVQAPATDVQPPSAAQPGAPPAPAAGAAGAAAPLTPALHEVTPSVSKSAARSIRGHVEIAVRATIRPDGSVSSAAVDRDRSGRSRYFQRVAIDAAKKWMFVPVHTAPARHVQIQFTFSPDGTTVHATPLE